MTNELSEELSTIECIELSTLMNQKYEHYLNGRTFEVKTSFEDNAAYACITLQSSDQSFFYPVEGRVKLAETDKSIKESTIFLIDYIDLYFEEYLTESEEDLNLPLDWSDFKWDAVTFQLKGQKINKQLEAQTDQLLGEHQLH